MSFEVALERFKEKSLAVVRDDSTETARAALVSPAMGISPEQVNSLLHISGGHLFAVLSGERAGKLGIRGMRDEQSLSLVSSNPHLGGMLASVEAREGITTGISAFDRSRTLQILGDEEADSRELVQPGHIFPVVARNGGTLVRSALPEASYDLIRLSDKGPCAVLLDMLDEEGAFLSADAQDRIARELDIPVIDLSTIVSFRLANESLVERVAEAKLPTKLAGDLRSIAYRATLFGGEHVALVKGEISSSEPTLCRVQSESPIEDLTGLSQDSGKTKIETALARIGQNGSGVFLYLRKPDSGFLARQLEQNSGGFALPERMREYGIGAQILRDLGVRKIRLLSASQRNLTGLAPFGIEIVEQESL